MLPDFGPMLPGPHGSHAPISHDYRQRVKSSFVLLLYLLGGLLYLLMAQLRRGQSWKECF